MVEKMLARQNLRRRHDGRLAAGLDHGRGGQQRDQRLARADIAMQQPQHAVGVRARSATMSATARSCDGVSA